MVNKFDLMERKIKTKNPKINIPYSQFRKTEEWAIIEYLLKELENNQDIELKTAPEYVIGYLVEKLRNKDFLKNKERVKVISQSQGRNNNVSLHLNTRSR